MHLFLNLYQNEFSNVRIIFTSKFTSYITYKMQYENQGTWFWLQMHMYWENQSMYLTLPDFVTPLSWYLGLIHPWDDANFNFTPALFSTLSISWKVSLPLLYFSKKSSSSLSEVELCYFDWWLFYYLCSLEWSLVFTFWSHLRKFTNYET